MSSVVGTALTAFAIDVDDGFVFIEGVHGGVLKVGIGAGRGVLVSLPLVLVHGEFM